MVMQQRAPIDALAVLPMAKLCQRHGVYYCLSALGMDEIMGGYPYFTVTPSGMYREVEDQALWKCQSYYVWINKTHSAGYVDLRFPFLNSQFINYARSLPRRQKVDNQATKRRLREELLRFTTIPYENAMAGRLAGTKGGFTPFLEDWWSRGLGDWCDQMWDHVLDYFNLLDRAKLRIAKTYSRDDLNLWVRLRCATTAVFLKMVEDGAFTT
jgi:asparagine synthetase B (glutamine-hydrolysing)